MYSLVIACAETYLPGTKSINWRESDSVKQKKWWPSVEPITAYSFPFWVNPQHPLYLTFDEFESIVSDCQLSSRMVFLKFCPKQVLKTNTTRKKKKL